MILSLLLSAQISFSDIRIFPTSSGDPLFAESATDVTYSKKGKGVKGKGGKGKGGKGSKGGKGGNKSGEKGGSKNCTTAQKKAVAVAAEESYIACETLVYETYQLVQSRYETEVKKCEKEYDATLKTCK